MSTDQPVLIVSPALSYDIILPESSRVVGYVGENGPFDGKRSRFTVLYGGYDDATFAMVKREFETVLHANDVLYDDANRADLGPLPGHYVGHPWAVRLVDTIAIECEVMALLSTIPASVRLQCYHNGEGDQETVALLPFDGWEHLDQLLLAAPCGLGVEAIVGADVMRLMRAKQSASPALCKGELHWQIDQGALPSEQEAARVRRQVEAIRTGANIKQGRLLMK